jgi:hypothetical protein
MNYEEFKELWAWALRESGLPVFAGEGVEETLDLRTTARRCRQFVRPADDGAAVFHVSAELGFVWDALQVARTLSTEDDLIRELFGGARSVYPRTEPPWLRVDVSLHATTTWGRELAMPAAEVWRSWARETSGRLENVEPLLPIEQVRENRKGGLEILAWKGPPTLDVMCAADGGLLLKGVQLKALQVIGLPRKWDDESRKQDKGPGDQLAALFRRLKAALHGWTEALDHLAPTN